MILVIFVLASPRPFLRSKKAFLDNLMYCIGVFAKANTIRPNGLACCCDILSGLEDCCVSSAISWKSKKACSSAFALVIPSATYIFILFLINEAPPIAIAKLSAICVGKKPAFNNEANTALALFVSFSAALAISSALTSFFKPDLLCFKKSELNIIEKSLQNCFWFAKAFAACIGLLSCQFIKFTIDKVCSNADLVLKNIIVPTESLTQFIKRLVSLFAPDGLLRPVFIL